MNCIDFRGWCIENFPFIEDDFDALTDYQLMCKLKEYVVNIGNDVGTLENKYNELVSQIAELETIVENMSGEFDDLVAEFNSLKTLVQSYDMRIQANAHRIEEVNTNLQNLISLNIDDVRGDIADLKTYVDNQDVGLKQYVDDQDATLLSGINAISTEVTNIKAELEIISEALDRIRATGTSITLTPTIKNAKLDIELNPSELSQETTTGKQLFNNTGTSQTINDVVFTVNEDGSIKANGTASASISFVLGTFSGTNGTNYLLSGVSNGATSSYYLNLQGVENNLNGDSSFTGDGNSHNLSLIIASGIQLSNVMFYPMIRLASVSDNTYEKYTNGPQPNPQYPSDVHVISGDNTIKVENKNKFNPPANQTINFGTGNARTLTINNGKFSITGSDGGVAGIIDLGGDYVIKANDYLYFFNNQGSFSVFLYDNTESTTYFASLSINNANTIVSLNDYAGTTLGRINFYVNPNQGSKTFEFTPMICNISTTTSYVAHQEQVKPLNLPVENKFNVNGTYTNTGCNVSVSNGEVTQTNTGTYSRTGWTISNLKVGEKYTLSFSYENNSSSAIQAMIRNSTDDTTIAYTEATTNTSGKDNLTFTATETTHKIRLYSNATNTSNSSVVKFSKIQFEPGTKANTYNAYGNPAIEYCDIGTYSDHFFKAVDGDSIYDTLDSTTKASLTSGKWYIQKNVGKVVLIGSDDETYTATGLAFLYSTYLYPATDNALSSHFTYSSSWTSSSDTYRGKMNFTSGRIRFMPTDSNINTVALFKTWLSSHNVSLYFANTTPTYTLLNDTLQQQLDDIYKTLKAYNGQTNITQINHDLPFIMTTTTLKKGSVTDEV